MMIDGLMNVPYLRVMTFEALNHKWIVISQKGLSYCRLERHLERKAWVASFGRPKMTSQSLLASQTGLSPYLRWGCLIFLSSLIFGFIVYFLDTCDERKNQSTGSRQAVLRSSALFSGSGSPQLGVPPPLLAAPAPGLFVLEASAPGSGERTLFCFISRISSSVF